MPALIPPDREQCQAMRPNGHTFMTLGGIPGLKRCTEKPTVVITEVKPGDDGRRGSMSVCSHCLGMAYKSFGQDYFTKELLGT